MPAGIMCAGCLERIHNELHDMHGKLVTRLVAARAVYKRCTHRPVRLRSAQRGLQEITVEFHARGAVRDALRARGAALRRGRYDTAGPPALHY